MKNILVTGAAGFIGYQICKKLIQTNNQIIGLDNLNSYYDTSLKYARLGKLDDYSKTNKSNWKFIKGELIKEDQLEKIFKEFKVDTVINMAAQAGVRYSIENPNSYLNSNLIGFANILEMCRKFDIDNLIYASSSSVYGGNIKYPYSEKDQVNHPISLYAATKKSNELMAHSYSHLFGIPCTGLRFFTVYGPWGRPDMAPMIFTKAILEGKPIKLFNSGNMYRDFTFVEDITEIFEELIAKPATENKNFNRESPDPSTSWCPHRIFNIGNNQPILISDFIKMLEEELGLKAIINNYKMQPGDIEKTTAEISLIRDWVGYKTKTSINEGIKKFLFWYKEYYGI